MSLPAITHVFRAARDPELRYLSDRGDGPLAALTLRCASSWSRRGDDGQWHDVEKLFIDVKTVGDAAEIEATATSIHSGAEVLVTGTLRTEEWKNKNGENRSAITIKARSIRALPPRPKASYVRPAMPDEGAQDEAPPF